MQACDPVWTGGVQSFYVWLSSCPGVICWGLFHCIPFIPLSGDHILMGLFLSLLFHPTGPVVCSLTNPTVFNDCSCTVDLNLGLWQSPTLLLSYSVGSSGSFCFSVKTRDSYHWHRWGFLGSCQFYTIDYAGRASIWYSSSSHPQT